MDSPLGLACTCGTLRGHLTEAPASATNRLVCLCIDCQAYAYWLGRPAEILDQQGGTEVVQTTPSRVRLTQGLEQLRCMRWSAKGLLRWYADCCRTPVANTLGVAWLPFVGVPRAFLSADDAALERCIGPVTERVNDRSAPKGCPPDVHACALDEGCYPTNDIFTCAPHTTSSDPYGTPCEFLNACNAGLFCGSRSDVDGCPSGALRCCNDYCDTTAADPGCTSANAQCASWYATDPISQGFEDLGACIVP